MKTEDLIRSYMKEHYKAGSDSERDKKQIKPKAVKPVTLRGR